MELTLSSVRRILDSDWNRFSKFIPFLFRNKVQLAFRHKAVVTRLRAFFAFRLDVWRTIFPVVTTDAFTSKWSVSASATAEGPLISTIPLHVEFMCQYHVSRNDEWYTVGRVEFIYPLNACLRSDRSIVCNNWELYLKWWHSLPKIVPCDLFQYISALFNGI